METAGGEAPPRAGAGNDLTCDIVLKGGITSGIVYPATVCRLVPLRQRRGRFGRGDRDRIVTVYLPPGLGGLNLQMDATGIDVLVRGGADAGDLLVTRFAATSGDGWRNHRWVRFRSFMGMVEGLLAHVAARWDIADGSAPSYHDLADDVDRPGGYPCRALSSRGSTTGRARCTRCPPGGQSRWPIPPAGRRPAASPTASHVPVGCGVPSPNSS